jgi:uncharacterized membrane protein
MSSTEESPSQPRPAMPVVRNIAVADLRACLATGFADFRRAPLYGLFFGAVYALGGLLIVALVFQFGMPYLAYPLAIGFALIGPFIAVGLYEVSRRLEAGRPLDWPGILRVIYDQRRRELSWMGFVVLFVLWIWLYQVRLLIALFLGSRATIDLGRFLHVVVSTPEGLIFLAVGHLVGAILALVLFSVTVIACPLLLDRNVDFVTAIVTSVKTVATSPLPMILWGLLVVVLILVASVPAFLGLFVVLPVLGHATWHLYRRAVAP